jgi:hypothetical protein
MKRLGWVLLASSFLSLSSGANADEAVPDLPEGLGAELDDPGGRVLLGEFERRQPRLVGLLVRVAELLEGGDVPSLGQFADAEVGGRPGLA